MKQEEKKEIGIGFLLGVIILAICLAIGGIADSVESRRIEKSIARHEQEKDLDRENWEKEKRIADSLAVIKHKEDSIKLVEVSKVYGQNFRSIKSKLDERACVYTPEVIETWCEMVKHYGLQCVFDEIDTNGVGCSSESLNNRSKYQKRLGRTKANQIISLCRNGFAGTDWNDVETIANHRVRIGFTDKQCRLAWGTPRNINRTTTPYGTTEQWCYSGYNYLYFDDGILTSIQN